MTVTYRDLSIRLQSVDVVVIPHHRPVGYLYYQDWFLPRDLPPVHLYDVIRIKGVIHESAD